MLDLFKSRMANQGSIQAKACLQNADIVIDKTFTRDPAYKEVYLTHVLSGIESQKMDAKFFIHSRQTLSSDEVDYYLTFRPHIYAPVGSYVDIPDSEGELHRWLIVMVDTRPQYPMHYVLKCNWTLKWKIGDKFYKVFGVLRDQKNYGSGLWTDYQFTTVDNVNLFWMPTTPYTQTVTYDQRVLINDDGRTIPIAWRVSKIQDVQPRGITELTVSQEQAIIPGDCAKFGIADLCPYKEYKGSNFDMCAQCAVEEPIYIDAGLELPSLEIRKGRITYNGKDTSIRVGGSAKTFTAEYWDVDKFTSYNAFWNISLINMEDTLCSINAHFDGAWNISQASSGFEIASSINENICEVKCFIDGKIICNVKLAPSDNSIKVSCAQLYSMVGKKLKLTSKDSMGQNNAEIIVEVIS